MSKGKALYEVLKDRLRKYYRPAIYRDLKQTKENRKQFYRSFLKQRSLVFDVGANMGNRIEPLAELGMKVVAFEPQSACYQFLKLKFRNKAIILNTALGSKKGEAVIHLNSESSTIASMSGDWIKSVKEGRFSKGEWSQTERVKTDTLDQMIDIYGIPEFIKIDVEGFEAEVLRGLTHQVPMISFEYTIPEQTSSVLECIGLIAGISSAYTFNYAIGEQNHFALPEWITADAIKTLLNENPLQFDGFGDIYARLIK